MGSISHAYACCSAYPLTSLTTYMNMSMHLHGVVVSNVTNQCYCRQNMKISAASDECRKPKSKHAKSHNAKADLTAEAFLILAHMRGARMNGMQVAFLPVGYIPGIGLSYFAVVSHRSGREDANGRLGSPSRELNNWHGECLDLRRRLWIGKLVELELGLCSRGQCSTEQSRTTTAVLTVLQESEHALAGDLGMQVAKTV
ncbi:hypothetical protein B0O99DRAFT_289926 [Bisporella sp. PMI_857]|nr:hypothetical protein B0O99DRAFT_289926 [Bisporella sp. PMI_857]